MAVDLTRLAAELETRSRSGRHERRVSGWKQRAPARVQLRFARHGRSVKLHARPADCSRGSRHLHLAAVALTIRLLTQLPAVVRVDPPSSFRWVLTTGIAVSSLSFARAFRDSKISAPGHRRSGLVLAGLWRIPFFLSSPGPDDDIHRYLWDGRVQRLGYNPYLKWFHSDPAVRELLHTPETRTLEQSGFLPSPYPPGAQMFFRAITGIPAESLFSLKVAFVFCDLAIVLVLFEILRRGGSQGAHLGAGLTPGIHCWQPTCGAGSGPGVHRYCRRNLLLLVSAAALGRRWRPVAAVVIWAGSWQPVAVKFLPIAACRSTGNTSFVSADGILRSHRRWTLYVPFLNHGRIPIGVPCSNLRCGASASMIRCSPHSSASGPLCSLRLGWPWLRGFLVALWLRSKATECSPDTFAWPMAASLLCAPVIYPWYLLWLLPFCALRFSNGPDHHLDSQHHSYLLRLAFALA